MAKIQLSMLVAIPKFGKKQLGQEVVSNEERNVISSKFLESFKGLVCKCHWLNKAEDVLFEIGIVGTEFDALRLIAYIQATFCKYKGIQWNMIQCSYIRDAYSLASENQVRAKIVSGWNAVMMSTTIINESSGNDGETESDTGAVKDDHDLERSDLDD